ncbi:uncharacterized protein LOC143446976 isoform X2 [Clavelina lepadiformis]|uniref:uncharacterized protein LOC143446976 isoform X2 n=1 Tax=Clavelina lepadiformis TaxID=159417 RepID=UPI004042D4FB
MEKREARDTNTKLGDKEFEESSVRRYGNKHTSLSSRTAQFEFEDNFDICDNTDSAPASSDQENEAKMTKDVMEDKLKSSKPINIPRVKITNVDAHTDERKPIRFPNRFTPSPPSSLGDTVYDSPTLPRPSNDFNHVMIKLRRRGDIDRVRSCETVDDSSDGESCISSFRATPISMSVPERSGQKGRRTVHFDETTITLTAELGESAARFRSQWRKKRATNNSTRFGESKNISIYHDDNEMPSPEPERANTSNGKSIFDICNYSSYGRYT